MKKIAKIIGKCFGFVFGGIIALFVLAWMTLAVGKYFIYADYYRIWSREARNPGLNKGYVPQGCTFNDDENYFVTVGYMKDESASRIYKIDKKNRKIQYYSLVSEGENFYGHTGGIQYARGNFYIANESDGIYEFSAKLLGSQNVVEIGSAIKIDNHSSFVFSDDEFLFVGEFNDDKKYACNNEFSFNGKTHKAMVAKYDFGDFENPVALYSIPNQIQGFAITDEGTIVLSRSYGMVSSNFYIFNSWAIEDTGAEINGAKVYFLDKDNASKNLKAPAMSEDLDYRNGKVLYLSESACNKYVLGKFFADFFIYGLKIE